MMETSDIKALQRKILEIFVEIDRLCEEHGLRYFAIGGTCLGAVRHQGFIPWDDDMDIAMPRADYERFKQLADAAFPPYLQILKDNGCRHYLYPFSKVHDNRTTLVEERMRCYPDRYTGVFVDVMPLDGIPDGRIRRSLYFHRLKWFTYLDYAQKFCGDAAFYHGPRFKDAVKKVLFWMTRGKPEYYYGKKKTALMKKYDFEKSRDLAYTWSMKGAKYVFPKEAFDEYVVLPFEDVHIRCPVGYDAFLKAIYGDYMELPPPEKRVGGHKPDIIDLEHPFSSYLPHPSI